MGWLVFLWGEAMQYTIAGEIAQQVRLDLEPGEPVWASRGSLMSYSADVHWQLRVPGGLGGALRRSLAGEGVSLTFISTESHHQHVRLASSAPGHIADWDLSHGPVITTRGSFLAAWGDPIDIDVIIARRAGAAFFGGAGLFLQRISGRGTALIHGSGDFVIHDLAPQEQIVVSTGHLAAFADTVDYDIQGVRGCRNVLFGGEGLFMTRLTGPGRVLLQSLLRKGTVAMSSSSG